MLTATSVLVQMPPTARRCRSLLEANGRVATLTITPRRVGRNAITAVLADASGGPLDPAAVEIELGNPAAGIEPMPRPMRHIGAGRYHHEGGELAFAGTWHIGIRARMDDFEQVGWSARFDLQ